MKIIRQILAAILFLNQTAVAQMPGLPGGPATGTSGTPNPAGGYQSTALPGEGQKFPPSGSGPGVQNGQANPTDPNAKTGSGQPDPSRDYSRQDNPAMGYDPNSSNLTDAEYQKSKQYHEGKAQREYEDKCIKTTDVDTQKACAGQEADGKVLGISTKMMGMIAKAYVMVIGIGGVGDTYKVKPDTNDKEDKGERKDYCKYIAVGTEAIAMFQQMSAQNNLQNTTGPEQHKQIAQLEKAKLSHEERAKTAKIQAVGWTATGGCYVATITYGAIANGTPFTSNLGSLYLKLAASVIFSVFSWKQVQAHNDYADRIADIIKNFETKNGNCNPITQRNCYCMQPDTENDPTYCMPQMHQRKIAAGALRIACLNNELKADPKCLCAQTDSCFDKKFFSMTSGLNFGSANDPVRKTLEDFSRGQLTGGGKLNTATLKQNALRALATTRSTLDNASASDLNANQMAEAKEAAAFANLPANAAMALAAQPMTPEAQKHLSTFRNSLASYDSGGRGGFDSSGMAKSNVMYFGGGNINAQKAKQDGGINPDMFKIPGKSGAQKTNYLNFQEKAMQQAQINKRSDTNLFEIISNRYRITGRRVLEIKD